MPLTPLNHNQKTWCPHRAGSTVASTAAARLNMTPSGGRISIPSAPGSSSQFSPLREAAGLIFILVDTVLRNLCKKQTNKKQLGSLAGLSAEDRVRFLWVTATH